MSGAVAKLGKPQLRGLLAKQIKTNIGVGMVLAGIAGVITNYTLCKPRRERYAEFYKNYDPEEDFRNMVKSGADFQSLQS